MNATAYAAINEVARFNTVIRSLDDMYRAGIFCVNAMHPQNIDMLRQADYDQLVKRQVKIARLSGRGYRTEYMNIRKVKKEIIERQYRQEFRDWLRAQENEAVAREMLDAGKAQQSKLADRIDAALAVGQAAELMGAH